jgi:hypothetical protein
MLGPRGSVSWPWLLCGAALLLAMAPAPLQGLSSAEVAAVAIYKAGNTTTDSLPDHLVNYNITSPDMIDVLFAGIHLEEELDCDGIESKNTAYLYVKLHDGSRKIYHAFLLNSHVALQGRRVPCFWVDDPVQQLITDNAQP